MLLPRWLGSYYNAADQPGILYQCDREYIEGLKRDGGVGQGPAFEALAPHQR
jgi:hypothetical protein